jgi:hypothetical protein
MQLSSRRDCVHRNYCRKHQLFGFPSPVDKMQRLEAKNADLVKELERVKREIEKLKSENAKLARGRSLPNERTMTEANQN